VQIVCAICGLIAVQALPLDAKWQMIGAPKQPLTPEQKLIAQRAIDGLLHSFWTPGLDVSCLH